MIKRIKKYLKEIFQEFKQVTFPSKKEVLKYTKILLLICFFIAFYLGFLDFIFSRIVQFILRF